MTGWRWGGPAGVHAGLSGLAHPVVQVGYPVPWDDVGVIEQERGSGVVTEVPDAWAEYDRHQVEPDFVDQPGLEGLAGDAAGGYRHVPVTGDGLRLGQRAVQAVGDEGERRVWKWPAG